MKKKNLFFSFALLLGSTLTYGQAKEKVYAVSLEQGPKIEFENETHDFGKIPQGTPVTYEFKFKNTGNEALVINQPKGSCGCTTPYAPKEPIMPGDEDFIKVKYNAAKLGDFRKSVTVPTNTGDDVITLFIKGTVEKSDASK
ncbi:MAG: DUF1573 domain-containing protein [Flavobacteriales bacterium]|nr:DUF1573 domain-containing protein [Flavobacteriales bacterium]